VAVDYRIEIRLAKLALCRSINNIFTTGESPGISWGRVRAQLEACSHTPALD
jgi:hypothetical protein